jgi:tripartite-type tricarboxylate transporter receptor subunit TctC
VRPNIDIDTSCAADGRDANGKDTMTVALIVALAWLLFATPLGSLHAQDVPYKGKTIRVIVGFPSGGGADAEGRVLAR